MGMVGCPEWGLTLPQADSPMTHGYVRTDYTEWMVFVASFITAFSDWMGRQSLSFRLFFCPFDQFFCHFDQREKSFLAAIQKISRSARDIDFSLRSK